MEIIALLLFGAVVVGVDLYFKGRTKVFKLPEDSALNEPIKLDELADDPDKLARLAETVSSVGVVANEPSANSRAGRIRYEAFVVDTNGIPNTFAEATDRGEVVSKARQLADQLGVALEDQTY